MTTYQWILIVLLAAVLSYICGNYVEKRKIMIVLHRMHVDLPQPDEVNEMNVLDAAIDLGRAKAINEILDNL